MSNFLFNPTIAAQYAEKLRAGEDIQELIKGAQAQLAADHEAMRTLFETTGYDKRSPAEMQSGLAGLEHYHASLDAFWDALDSGDEEPIEEALELAAKGQRLIQAARRQNGDTEELQIIDFGA